MWFCCYSNYLAFSFAYQLFPFSLLDFKTIQLIFYLLEEGIFFP